MHSPRNLGTGCGRKPVRSCHMTRTTDEFLRLDDRVRIAREQEADLFISIHADTIRFKEIRGATVYTVSDKASDAEAQALADRENLSDQLAGIEIEERESEVADILVDLIRRETHSLLDAVSPARWSARCRRQRRPDQQSAPLRRLQGAQGAGRAVGPGRTRLSLQRQGRRAVAQPGMARQGGDVDLQCDRSICRVEGRQPAADRVRPSVAAGVREPHGDFAGISETWRECCRILSTSGRHGCSWRCTLG